MSTGPNRILDEFAKLMTDAAGAAQGVRKRWKRPSPVSAERMLNSMDLVQREEFEARPRNGAQGYAPKTKSSPRGIAELESRGVRERKRRPASRPAAKK